MEALVERFRYSPGVLVGDTLHIAGWSVAVPT
jgi:hypothetical protein